ncbi:integrase, partial [Escherichia coli]|nr:integrase [Escherichia coli]
IRREAATEKGERTGQAVPLRWDDLKLLDVLLSRSDRLVDLRNRAFLFLAYNTLLRMAEMSRVRVRDLEQTGDTVTLHVSHTKT